LLSKRWVVYVEVWRSGVLASLSVYGYRVVLNVESLIVAEA
jgi:hypothetical protein